MSTLFSFLLGKINTENFFNDFYSKKTVLIKGQPDKFDHIFSLDSFNKILNYNSLNYPETRVTDHHNTIHKYNLIDDKDRYSNNLNNAINQEKLMLAIARGGTLVFDKIHHHSKTLEDFVDGLSVEINTKISVNAYYTARNQLGVNPHFDRHDVFAIQIHGSKRWYYKEDKHILSKPMRHQKTPAVDNKYSGWNSVLLEKGDVFYCPRGVWHFTRTEDKNSAHLALGIYPMTLKDWLVQLERNEEVAEILEQYVQMPYYPDDYAILQEKLNKFINYLQPSACHAFDQTVEARHHIELD